MSNHTSLITILVKLTTSKHGSIGLDTYVSREVPVPEGDEAKILT